MENFLMGDFARKLGSGPERHHYYVVTGKESHSDVRTTRVRNMTGETTIELQETPFEVENP
jgi:hypothetical protein